MSNFYVYEHWRPDRDECFYVGKGRGKRANQMDSRNKHHIAIQQKLKKLGMGVEVRIVAFNLQEEEAFAIEKGRISFWRQSNIDLANHTNGGEGISGYKFTKEQKKKISLTHKGVKKSKEFKEMISFIHSGKIVSEESKKRMSIAQKSLRQRVPISEYTRQRVKEVHSGKIVSDETRKKMSEAAKKHHKEFPRGEGVRKKIGDSQRGIKRKPHSAETKLKMSQSAKAWREARRLLKAKLLSEA